MLAFRTPLFTHSLHVSLICIELLRIFAFATELPDRLKSILKEDKALIQLAVGKQKAYLILIP